CGVNLAAANAVYSLAGTGAPGPLEVAPPSNPPAPYGTYTPPASTLGLDFNFDLPVAVAATSGASPVIYVCDRDLNEIFLLDASGKLNECVGLGAAGAWAQGNYDSPHPATAVAKGAGIKLPTGLLLDGASGALFIADTGNAAGNDEIHVVNTSAAPLSICGVSALAPGNIAP